jgi:hypothetical protein
MICPHCNKTIREEQRYLMSRTDPEAGWPRWAGPAMWLMLFLFLTATLALFSHVAAS